MSKGNTFENDQLKLWFNGTPIPGLADNAASGALLQLHVTLHTADPGEAGAQNTNEVIYNGMARVAVPRTAGGWTITGDSVSPANVIEFPEVLAGSTASVATHASIGTAASGAGKIMYSGALSPVINIDVGVVPRIRQSSTITED